MFFNLRKKADSSTVSDAFLFSATHNWFAERQKEENPNERKLTMIKGKGSGEAGPFTY